MDIVRKPPTLKSRNKVLLIVGLVLIIGLGVYFLWASSYASYVIERDRISVGQVEQGELAVSLRGIGVLAPKHVLWLATNVEGKVERIVVKAGALVKQGDIIMQLSNPQLVQRLEESQWDLDEQDAQSIALRVTLESQVLDQEAQVIHEKLNYERSLLTLNAQNTLLKQGINAVSQIDHEAVKIDVAQNKQRWELEIQRLSKQKENAAAQMLANLARVSRLRKTVERIQQQVDNLEVKASMDAIVQAMPMELGQQVTAGTNLARLAKRYEFIAELRIPENQIQDVVIGQSVSIDTRSSKVEGEVKRIDPQVINGVVQVDVELIGTAPKEARPELTVEGVIEIVRLPNTLFVKRPMFAKSYDQAYVYLLAENGDVANKQVVTFGKASNTFIEVKTGLSVGQNIIVSDVSAWEQHQQIRIN